RSCRGSVANGLTANACKTCLHPPPLSPPPAPTSPCTHNDSRPGGLLRLNTTTKTVACSEVPPHHKTYRHLHWQQHTRLRLSRTKTKEEKSKVILITLLYRLVLLSP
ncbi:unnamed protein product, partial [Ectocarpus fasciculatus]